ncbi:MAG TPA: glycosyltransferase, partial [Solirubrobacteraceae bacterium]|nr:glycosyltransferase [Solirubrobacteraceae bacterium]
AELRAAGARDVDLLPVLADPDRLGPPGAPDPPGPPTLLFVGRLMPHKRQDAVIRALTLYAREHAPDARLVLVGEPVSARYGERLRALAEQLAPGAVTFEQSLSSAQLGERYRAAHAFLALSEHEGFCVPLLEAMRLGVPVVARPAGAVPEVAGEAALLVDDEDLAVVAELVHLAVTDTDLRAELRRRGRARAQELAPERTAQRLRGVLEAVSLRG